jgi:hypothetical protein
MNQAWGDMYLPRILGYSQKFAERRVIPSIDGECSTVTIESSGESVMLADITTRISFSSCGRDAQDLDQKSVRNDP